MFSIEYTEKEFAERLYVAIGFLGGNFRYRDSARFWTILASYHGRYHTIGVADLRATDMSPRYSGGFRSTDSEAMNIVEVMGEVQRICGEQVTIYTGDGHTTSRSYVDGLNTRKMVEDLGHLIVYNVRKSIIPVYDICEAVERSNHVKRKTRIVEGSKARVERHNERWSFIDCC
jgi:hypothetical protein